MSSIVAEQNAKYFNVELISITSPAYKRNNRKYKTISDKVQFKPVDHYVSSYNKALMKWEFVVQSVLASISNEHKNRILKFTDKNSNTRFRDTGY
jgi:5'(3')-deoxyribonucleotidase